MNKIRHSECILYNQYRLDHYGSNKHIREHGCDGCEGMKKMDMFKPTEKQLRFIEKIEDELGIHFMGVTKDDVTKDDARKWISNNVDDYNDRMCQRKNIRFTDPCICTWDDGMAWERMEAY